MCLRRSSLQLSIAQLRSSKRKYASGPVWGLSGCTRQRCCKCSGECLVALVRPQQRSFWCLGAPCACIWPTSLPDQRLLTPSTQHANSGVGQDARQGSIAGAARCFGGMDSGRISIVLPACKPRRGTGPGWVDVGVCAPQLRHKLDRHLQHAQGHARQQSQHSL